MSIHPVRADAGLGGLVFLIAFIALSFINALRRGKPPESIPIKPQPTAPRRAAYAPKTRDIGEETPQVVPLSPASAPGLDEAVRRLEAAEAALGADPVSPHAWSKLGIRGREEWQRGVILSEVLQRPLSLRPDW